ncbi:MAG: hypothetical protein K2G38_05520 [Clostridia bacterium]|nr:hypothetical protein [Clostridia bacterium]
MKLKNKRNLLTVMLSVLCAALIAVGISFMLPKNEKTAQAATATSSQTTLTPTLTFGTTKYYTDVAYGSCSYSSMSTTQPSYVTVTKGTDSIAITLTCSGSDYKENTVVAIPVILSITVPAYTVYTVEYTTSYSNSGQYGREHGLIDGWQSGNSGDYTHNCSYIQNSQPSPDLSGQFWLNSTGAHPSGYGVVFYNNTSSSTTMEANTFYHAYVAHGAQNGRVYTFNATFSNLKVNAINIDDPTTTDDTTPETYDGTAKTFNFSYNFPQVTDFGENFAYATNDAIDTTVEAEDYDGDPIASSTYSLNDTVENGTLTATEAGKYKVKFNIKADIVAGEVKWASGGTAEKSFTFEIEHAKLTVPQITNSPQTYNPSGSHFSLDSNYDPATMTPSGVTSGITWNTTTSKFDATTANTYTVKIALNDKKNYEWDVSGDKTADQTATVKIDKQKLTVPSTTKSQEYTGSALTFTLANFNSGSYIKVDSVTSTGGNTVTGASGAAIIDTTGTFEATNVDKYTATLSLRDTTNYVWQDNSNSSKTVDFEITQKELLSIAPVSSKTNTIGNAEWEFGDSTVTITITDDRFTGENVSLLCYYDVVGGTSKSNTLTNVTNTGNTTVITMPSTIAVGKYTLTVELDGNTGDNANYKITKNNTLNFEVTSGKIDPSTYGWIYTKDGAAGGTIANGDKLPFELKANSATDGVKYEVSIQIPSSDASAVAVDTSKYVNGYKTQSSDKVGTVKTIVALKSIDPAFQFEVSGNKQNTIEVELNWEIEKGTFDLTNVKWEYSLDGSTWADYDSTNPPQYNDGDYITVRVKASTLPSGLSLDSLYTGSEEYDVDNSYVATVSASDLKYNTANFNAPDVSKMSLSWEIAKKNLFTSFKNVKESYSNANGSGSFILKQLNIDPKYENYIIYTYFDTNTGSPVTLDDIKAAADPTVVKKYKVVAAIDPAIAANYDMDDNGSTPSDNFETGSKNKLANVTIDGKDGSTPIKVDYDGSTHFDITLIQVTGDDGINVTDFTVTYYKGAKPTAGNELAAGELPKDVGEYCIEVVLGATAAKKYILATDWFAVEIQPMAIDLPTIGEIVFTGGEINLVDHMTGFDASLMEFVAGGDFEGLRDVSEHGYTVQIKLKDLNYRWNYDGNDKVKAAYSLSDYEINKTDASTAVYKWNITPLVIDTSKLWNKGKNGATLNLPQNVKDLIAGGTLELGYRYYDSDGQFVENPEMKGNKQYKVEAVFAGDDAVRNVQFKTGDTTMGNTSPAINYTVPQSGMQAFGGKVLSFLKNYWWWILIALAILILLIILIIVIAKRRKNKEEREEKKRLKEEEKRRREEEREAAREKQRAELEAARAKQQAELELVKAKQEAELAKMKAEAAAAAGMAGAAAMAAQPQQAQQPAQQPVAQQAQPQQQQSMPQPQPVQQQYPQQQPQPQYYPPQQPAYDAGALARLEAEFHEMRKEQRSDGKLENELLKLRLDMGGNNANAAQQAQQQPMMMPMGMMPNYGGMGMPYQQPMMFMPVPMNMNGQQSGGNDESGLAEKFGQMMASMMKSMGVKPQEKPVEIQVQSVEAESQPTSVSTPTVYPPDAVVTTTTTVDTTKKNSSHVQPRARRSNSDDGRMFDIDGFYDAFDENK